MLRTELPHASRVVSPAPARCLMAGGTSWSATKWNWRFWRVVMWPKPREYFSATSARAWSCAASRIPCGIFTRIICASPACRCPYVPRTRRYALHSSGLISPRSNRSSVATKWSISASSAKDSRVRPNVVGSSAIVMSFLLSRSALGQRTRVRERTRGQLGADRDHIADDDGSWSVQTIDGDRWRAERADSADPGMRSWCARGEAHCGGGFGSPATGDEQSRQRSAGRKPHQHDDG